MIWFVRALQNCITYFTLIQDYESFSGPLSFHLAVTEYKWVILQIHNKRARMARSENNNSKGLLVFPYNEKTAKQDGTAKVGPETLQMQSHTLLRICSQYACNPGLWLSERFEGCSSDLHLMWISRKALLLRRTVHITSKGSKKMSYQKGDCLNDRSTGWQNRLMSAAQAIIAGHVL